MEDLSSMTASERLAKRDAVRNEVASLIGQLVFNYSQFVTSLHLCMAWRDEGKGLEGYPSVAVDLSLPTF